MPGWCHYAGYTLALRPMWMERVLPRHWSTNGTMINSIETVTIDYSQGPENTKTIHHLCVCLSCAWTCMIYMELAICVDLGALYWITFKKKRICIVTRSWFLCIGTPVWLHSNVIAGANVCVVPDDASWNKLEAMVYITTCPHDMDSCLWSRSWYEIFRLIRRCLSLSQWELESLWNEKKQIRLLFTLGM